jgi:hypothetical protein
MEEYEVGDMVATYLINSSLYEPEMLQYGIVLRVNEEVQSILVLDNEGYTRWWSTMRWKIIQKAKKGLNV